MIGRFKCLISGPFGIDTESTHNFKESKQLQFCIQIVGKIQVFSGITHSNPGIPHWITNRVLGTITGRITLWRCVNPGPDCLYKISFIIVRRIIRIHKSVLRKRPPRGLAAGHAGNIHDIAERPLSTPVRDIGLRSQDITERLLHNTLNIII